MNILDIIFLILIGLSIIYSFIRGLVRELFSLLAIILGFFGATYGYLAMANWLRRWMGNETLAQVLGFAILFFLIALGLGLLGRALSRLLKKMDLSWADRMGGAAFGFIKAIFLIAIILLVLTAFLPSRSKLLSESRVSSVALTIARQLSYLVPEKLRTLYHLKEKELKKYWATKEPGIEKLGPTGGTKR
jgi:membrane protein required for colicin V production